MGEEVLLVALLRIVPAARSRRVHLPRVDVHPVLALLREGDVERDQVSAHVVRRVLGQPLLLRAVLVQGRHKVRQWAGHAELDLQLPSGEDEGVLVGDGHQAEQPGGLHRSPFTAGAVRQGHHDRLKILADDLELADALELHRLTGEVLPRCHCVREDVQEESSAARGVDSEGHHVAHHGLGSHSTVKFQWQKDQVAYRYLHDETLETDVLKRVRIVVVELQVVMENEAGLHVGRHADPDGNRS